VVNQVFGERYEVQQQLGKRAGRRTLLARDIKTQELVVIKLLSFGNDFEWDDLKFFEREAETLKSLSHAAIPRYLDYFELDSPSGKKVALVQTYVEGKSLEEHLKAGRTFSEANVKQIALSLLEILIYLHGRHPPVIHRDIKPSNILLHNRSGNSVGEVYLVDFGSVQTLAAREGGTITVVGTYGYMPQEQFGGRTVPASDLYSLGATLITLVTGTHPADLPQKDFRIQFEQASNLSPMLTSWLRWMTEPTLERRLASATQALQALEQELPERDDAPIVVRKPAGSKVTLLKNTNADFLEILLPCKGFAWVITVVFFVHLFSLLMGDDPFISPSIFWSTSIFLWLALSTSTKVRFRIDKQKISVINELWGFKLRCFHPFSRQDISKLQRTRQQQGRSLTPKLIIWAGIHRYEFNGQTLVWSKLLVEPELDWLAHELSEWLSIPITRE